MKSEWESWDDRQRDAWIAETLMGFRWMRWHDLDYKSPDGPIRANLCHPEQHWLEEPDYVEDRNCERSSVIYCEKKWEKQIHPSIYPDGVYPGGVPHYSTNADHDLLVLERCKYNSPEVRTKYFIEAIDSLIKRRDLPYQIAYYPGMWSEAAYVAYHRTKNMLVNDEIALGEFARFDSMEALLEDLKS